MNFFRLTKMTIQMTRPITELKLLKHRRMLRASPNTSSPQILQSCASSQGPAQSLLVNAAPELTLRGAFAREIEPVIPSSGFGKFPKLCIKIPR